MRDPRDRRFVATLAVAVALSLPAGVLVDAVVRIDHWAYAAAGFQIAAAPVCWWLAYVRLERPGATPIEVDTGGKFLLQVGASIVVLTAAYFLAPDDPPPWLLPVAVTAVVWLQHSYLDRASWIDLAE